MTFTDWDSDTDSAWKNLVDDIPNKRSKNNKTYETEKNVMEESTSSCFTFNIKDKMTFTFSKSNQVCEGKNCDNGFADFKKRR